MPLRNLVTPRNTLVTSCRRMGLPLYVLYDPDPQVDLRGKQRLPDGVHAEDIFAAMPGLLAMMQPGSAIERWHANHGSWEPFEGSMKKSHGVLAAKLLVRKVATIYYVLARLVRARLTLLWADQDVTFERPPDARFAAFVRSVDVAYVPFRAPKGHPRFDPRSFASSSLVDASWRVESGLMSFAPNGRSLALAAAAVELYEGGMERIASRCAAAKRRKQPCPAYVTNNLYLNDVYVWALLLHLVGAGLRFQPSATAASSVPAPPPCCCLDYNLTQGWFAFHTSTLTPLATNFTSPFNLSDYATHRLLGPYSMRRTGRVKESDPTLLFASLNYSRLLTRQPAGGSAERRIARCGCSDRPWTRMRR